MTKLLSRGRTGLLILASGLSIAPAHAAVPLPTQRIFESKSSAILGGAPSRLAMIRAQQRGETVAALVRPASLTTPVMRRAVLRPEAPAVRAAAWSGRPDLFGSVALKVGHTSLDARWKRTQAAPLSAAALAVSQSMRSLSPAEKVEAINRYVNREVTFTDDWRQYGRADRWAAAAETLRRGRGDCEDYAITKLQMLRAAGISPSDLYLVLVKDLVRRADHAVLVVRAEGRSLMLDNGTDMVVDAESVQDYRPIFTFASNGTYTHGYRRSFGPPMEVASNEATAPRTDVQLAMAERKQPVRPASDTSVKPIDGTDLALLQRSRSASLRAFITGFSR